VATSHQKMHPAERERLGIFPSLLRLSAGIEDPEDIIADLAQSLERASIS
jgi:cystathionine beta-lyase/cystathionine gamma-synthase